jgi:serine/threonine protein kinase
MSTETPGASSSQQNDRQDTRPAMENVGPYKIVQFLGEGGMGRVYLAHHRVLDRQVALKFMPDDVAKQTGWVDRFTSEARMLAKLDHPNIVRVYGAAADTAESRYYLEIEYVDGGDLEERIGRMGATVEEAEAKRILDEVLRAVEYAHGLSVIHRDLKPANILLRRDGTVKISDFGLAMVVGEDYHRSLIQKSITLSQLVSTETVEAASASMLSAVGGTLPFMSPQTKKGEPPDPRDDIYAVGVIAYNLLTGQLPEIDAGSVRGFRPSASKDWDRFFRKCIASRREDRFQTAAEARAALAIVGTGRNRRGVVLGAAALCAVCLGGALLWNPWNGGLLGGKNRPAPIVRKTPQGIAFEVPNAPVFVDQPVTLKATASSGLPVSFEVVAGPGRVAGGVLRFHGPGRVDVRASQPGDRFFDGAPPVDRAFAVVDRPLVAQAQTITFAPLPDRVSNEPPFALEATASSGLPVSFTLVSGPAKLEGGRLALTGPGTVVVQATQPGTPEFAPAAPVVRSFIVEKYYAPRITLSLPGGVAMTLALVPAGQAQLGPAPDEAGRSANDARSEPFAVAQPFYAGATEVTQAQYRALTGKNPSNNRFKGDTYPVEQVRYADLVGRGGFLEKMNEWLRANGMGGFEATLPTEQEWEYACRAGTTTALNNGAGLANPAKDAALDALAVYATTTTAAVAGKQPNAWGFYDMHGNVAEWTAEGHLRGGSFRDNAAACRAAARLRDQRGKTSPDDRFGFRLVLKPAAP